MKRFTIAAVLLFAIGCGPLGPMPGGRLSGPVETTPSSWAFGESLETAQLETRPDDPHSVNTWFTDVEGQLYVPTSMILGPTNPSERSWVVHVLEDPRVRIRIDSRVWERQAVRVAQDSPEYQTARASLEKKYEITVADRDPERTIWIFRLDARM